MSLGQRMALLVACIAFPGGVAFAEGSFDDLLGKWVGSGTVRLKAFEPRQAVRCRFEGVQQHQNQTFLKGRCATAQRSTKFELEISEQPGTSALTAIARLGSSTHGFAYAGARTKDGFEMRTKRPFRQGPRKLMSQISISIDGTTQVTISETVTDVATDEQSDTLVIQLTK